MELDLLEYSTFRICVHVNLICPQPTHRPTVRGTRAGALAKALGVGVMLCGASRPLRCSRLRVWRFNTFAGVRFIRKYYLGLL